MSFAFCIVSLLLLLVLLCAVQPVRTLKVALVSDVHYDPHYGTDGAFVCTSNTSPTYGRIGCDTPPALLHALRDDLRMQRVQHVFFGGDWHRHRFDALLHGCGNIVTELSRLFAGAVASPANVSVCLGNNDMVPNYGFNVRATSHPQLECEVQALADVGVLNTSEAEPMRVCGYYAHDAGNAVVISLHTLLWSHAMHPPVPEEDDDDDVTKGSARNSGNDASSMRNDPCGQFAFLHATLAAAREGGRRPVIVLGHIPPSANVYDIVRRQRFTGAPSDMYWKEPYRRRYAALMSEFKDVVRLQLFGHTHALAVLAATSEEGVAPGLVLPAFTPNYANYPSYIIAEFDGDDSWTLQTLQQRYITEDGQWHDGLHIVGALALRRGPADASDAQRVLSTLTRNDALWDNYLQLRGGGVARADVFPSRSCDAFCRAVSVCGMVNDTTDALRACVAAATAPSPPPPPDHGHGNNTTRTRASLVTAMLLLGMPVIVAAVLASMYAGERLRRGEVAYQRYAVATAPAVRTRHGASPRDVV